MKTYKLQTLCLALKPQPVLAKTTIPKKSTQVSDNEKSTGEASCNVFTTVTF